MAVLEFGLSQTNWSFEESASIVFLGVGTDMNFAV